MNFGEKLIKLKDSKNIKYFADYGKLVGVSGDWLNDNSKKDFPQILNIPNLIRIAHHHKISLDYFFAEDDEIINFIKTDLPEDDIGMMLDKIQEQLKNQTNFYGSKMSTECNQIASDSIDVVKQIIHSNI